MNDPAKNVTVTSIESRLIPAWQTRKKLHSEDDAIYEHEKNLGAVRDLAPEILPFTYAIKGHSEKYVKTNNIEIFHKGLMSDIDHIRKRGSHLRTPVAKELYNELERIYRASPVEVTDKLLMTFRKNLNERVEQCCNAGDITGAEKKVYLKAGNEAMDLIIQAQAITIKEKDSVTPYEIEQNGIISGSLVAIIGLLSPVPMLAIPAGGIAYLLHTTMAKSEYQDAIIEEFRQQFEQKRPQYIKRLMSTKINPRVLDR